MFSLCIQSTLAVPLDEGSRLLGTRLARRFFIQSLHATYNNLFNNCELADFLFFRLRETVPTTSFVELQTRIAKKPKKRGLEIVASPVVQLTCVMLAQLGRHYFGFLCCVLSFMKYLLAFFVLRKPLALNIINLKLQTLEKRRSGADTCEVCSITTA